MKLVGQQNCDFEFTPAVKRSKNCLAYRLTEPTIIDDQQGNKGDWIVKENNTLKLVYNRHFASEYTTADRRQAFDTKRIPKVEQGEIVNSILIKKGRRGNTDIRKDSKTSTYFIDDRDNINNRDAAPYVYLTLHCPFTERGINSGAYIEDVIDVLIDHINTSKTLINQKEVNQVLYNLYMIQKIITKHGVGVVDIPEDKRSRHNMTKKQSTIKRKCCGN